MGWTSIYQHFDSVKEFADSQLSWKDGEKWTMIDRSIRGNVVYSLITDGIDKMIYIDKVEVRDGCWSWKSFTENDHPYLYECPQKFLKASTQNGTYAIEWRSMCLKTQKDRLAKKAYVKSLKTGDLINTKYGELIFHSDYTASQFAARKVGGSLYRYKKDLIILPE